ncbi:unnamed protein product [Polarella glacialis]|uniref:Pentatricopeptide repeat-containing protein, chloroplastic n=1 Tax=Polarella glacialis TaxID=89957 RepID=A0A813JQ44_POLGL|nr:unnamed protein product [Polarella glacialis]
MLLQPHCEDLARSKCLTLAVSSLGRLSRWQAALEKVQEARTQGLRLSIIRCNAALTACARAHGPWTSALAVLQSLGSEGDSLPAPDLITLGAAIHACGLGGNWRTALALLGEMMAERRLRPDVVIFNEAISSCERGGQWQLALDLGCERLSQFGLPHLGGPDLVTCGSLCTACARGSLWQESLWLLAQLKISGAAARQLKRKQGPPGGDKEQQRSLQLSTQLCGAVISACAEARRWRWAQACFAALRQEGDVLPLSRGGLTSCRGAVLTGLARNSSWELATAELREMWRRSSSGRSREGGSA